MLPWIYLSNDLTQLVKCYLIQRDLDIHFNKFLLECVRFLIAESVWKQAFGLECLASIPSRSRYFFVHHRVHTGCSVHEPSCPAETWGLFTGGWSCRCMRTTTNLGLHLVPRLRIHGAVPVLLRTSSWGGANWMHRQLFLFIKIFI